MKLDFSTIITKLFKLKFGSLFGFKLHINLIPLGNVVLTLTDGTD